MTVDNQPSYLNAPAGHRIAYRRLEGEGPGLVFFGGFRSDMTGSKATFLEDYARRRGCAFLRFDYFGHGASDGSYEDGTIGLWREDCLAVLDELTQGPQVFIGSSMGGWLMLLAALARPEKAAALVGIAPAPDFTEELMWPAFDAESRALLERNGRLTLPSAYDSEPTVVTHRLIEESRAHLLLHSTIPLDQPVRLVHGLADPDVPYELSLRLATTLRSKDVTITLVKGGDHRLSTAEDLGRLARVLDQLFASGRV